MTDNPSPGKRLLVVDDDRLICWALAQEFSARSLTISVCHDGKDAFDRIRSGSYDLAILDVHLPDANGIAILEEIKRRSPGTRAIVMSADADAGSIRRAIAAGAEQFIEKPFDLPVFCGRVLGMFRDYPEPRKHARYACRIPLRISLLAALPPVAGLDLRNLDGIAEDAGFGGLLVATEYPLAPGQVVRVNAGGAEAADPFLHLIPPDATSEVRWTSLAAGGFKAGLSFRESPSLQGGPPGGEA